METGWKIIKYDEWCPKCKYQNTSATDVFKRAKLKFYKFDPNNLAKEEI